MLRLYLHLVLAAALFVAGPWFVFRLSEDTTAPVEVRAFLVSSADMVVSQLQGLDDQTLGERVRKMTRDRRGLRIVFPGDDEWEADIAAIASRGVNGRFYDVAAARTLIHFPANNAVVIDDPDFRPPSRWQSIPYRVALFVLPVALLAFYYYWLLRPTARRFSHLVEELDLRLQEGRFTPLPEDADSLMASVVHRFNRLMAHYQRTLEQAERSLLNQRDMMHAVTHEIRAPLARVRFAVDMLADSGSVRPGLQANVDSAIDELDRLAAELLGYSRLQYARYPLQRERFAVAESIGAVVESCLHEEPDVDVAYHPAHGPDLPCNFDRRLFERSVGNLVRNAMRFATHRVDIISRWSSGRWVVEVIDDGPGIPPGKRDCIFEPFMRLDLSRSRESGGFGLGLAIVRAITALHGGSVRADDRVDVQPGISFVLDWPDVTDT
ncbi:sensor histidine kinase [Tahibacter amnicola]|uniref:histidine kinase n=1 Tax=Tahibacter amnicola TaxID=2976241 RepID=A0ABY6BHM1_9GAMM|nr:ATP-binding protein [Tahibacter amnicola]UXI69007.1 ATP-binding protein [Tahibacter amnicola]